VQGLRSCLRFSSSVGKSSCRSRSVSHAGAPSASPICFLPRFSLCRALVPLPPACSDSGSSRIGFCLVAWSSAQGFLFDLFGSPMCHWFSSAELLVFTSARSSSGQNPSLLRPNPVLVKIIACFWLWWPVRSLNSCGDFCSLLGSACGFTPA
jgi:hypothetical protein